MEKERFGYDDGTKTALFEIAAQLAELNANLRDIHPELNLPEECRTRKCDYHTAYLTHGPAELTHEAYHEAVKQASEHMKSCARSERTGVCPICTGYEQRLRA